MIRTSLAAGVLSASVRGDPDMAQAACCLLADPQRDFASSVFLRREIVPNAFDQRRDAEIDNCERFLARVLAWADRKGELRRLAEREAARSGLKALGALHVAAAMMLAAAESATTEGLRKPLYRVTELRVVSI